MGLLYTSYLSKSKKIVTYLAALLFFLSFFFIPYDEIRTERIRAFGEKAAVGIVIDKNIRKGQISPSVEGKKNYMIKYRFIDPSGLPRERSANVDTNFWRKVTKGESVIVHFAKAEPGISRIEHEEESTVVRFLARFSRADMH